VLASARAYFAWAGPCYAFFGLGLCLFFSSQGSGRILGPVLAQSVRLLVIIAGGWWIAATDQPAPTLFALIGLAMVAYGLATVAAVYLTRWSPAARASAP
jgi:ABC-type uncharacterized transport system permease subunit